MFSSTSDPEECYATFVRNCNDITVAIEDVITNAQILASDSKEAIHLRRKLLRCEEVASTPSWDDFLRARLRFDLSNPTMFEISPLTKLLSVRMHVLHPRDKTSAASNCVGPQKHHDCKELDIYLKEEVYNASLVALKEKARRHANSLSLSKSSLRMLFGIPERTTSTQVARNIIRKTQYESRINLLRSFLVYTKINKYKKISKDTVKEFFKTNSRFEQPSATGGEQTTVLDRNKDSLVDKQSKTAICRVVTTNENNHEHVHASETADTERQQKAIEYTGHLTETANMGLADVQRENIASPHHECNAFVTTRCRKEEHQECLSSDESLAGTTVGHEESDDDIREFVDCQHTDNERKPSPKKRKATTQHSHQRNDNKKALVFRSLGDPSLEKVITQDALFVEQLRLKLYYAKPNGTFAHIDELFDNDHAVITDADTPASPPEIAHIEIAKPGNTTFASETNQQIKMIRLNTPLSPVVFTIDNFLSPTFLNDVIGELDQNLFMEGEGGREGSFIRIAYDNTECGDNHHSFFQIGKHLYPTYAATFTELKLIDIVNKLIQYQKNSDGTCPTYRYFRVNAIQIVAELISKTSGYAKHSDCGRLLNRFEGGNANTDKTEDKPNTHEMQTFTLVIVCGTIDSCSATHRLEFYDGENNRLGSLETRGNCLHAQLHGTQLFQHQVTPIHKDSTSTGSIRIVLSFRLLFPCDDSVLSDAYGTAFKDMKIKTEQYKWTGIVTAMTRMDDPKKTIDESKNNSFDRTNAEQVADTPPFCLYKVKDKSLLVDCYGQISREDYQQLNIFRNTTNLSAFPGYDWVYMFRGDAVREMITRHGRVPCRRSAGSPVYWSLLCRPDNRCPDQQKPFAPLECMSTVSVAAAGRLSHTSRAHPPTTGNPSTTNTMLLSRAYKNDVSSILNTLVILEKWDNTDREELAECAISQSTRLPDIYIYGSGGSPMSTDTYALDISQHQFKKFQTTCPHPQSTGHAQNQTMSALTERNGVVALFIDYGEFSPFMSEKTRTHIRAKIACDAAAAVFVGYYIFDQYEYKRLDKNTLDVLRRQDENMTTTLSPARFNDYLQKRGFLEEAHFKFRLRAMFPCREDLFNLKASGCVTPIYYFAEEKMGIVSSYPIHPTTGATTGNAVESFVQQLMLGQDVADRINYPLDAERGPSRSTNLSAQDIVVHAALVMVAGALRYLKRHCFAKNNDPALDIVAGPIPALYRFTTVYRCHPMPMSIRTYDIAPLFLRSCAISMSAINASNHRATGPINADLFFMSIINRLTGRPNLYCVFNTLFPSQPASSPRKNVASFVSFLNENHCHSKLFSSQHADAIPYDVRNCPHVFDKVIAHLARDCHTVLEEMSACASRKEAIQLLSEFLSTVVEEHKTHLNERGRPISKLLFLSHQIVCDVEEIYHDPFGSVVVDSIVLGFGSKQGSQVCCPEKNEAECLNTIYQTTTKLLLCDTQESVLMRRMLGLAIESNSLVVALNRRPFSFVDVEHILCKVYIAISKTMSSRSTSKFPKTARPGLHPARFSNNSAIPWDDENVCPIMLDIEKAYLDALVAGTITHTPAPFLLYEETDTIQNEILDPQDSIAV